jgi:hypothetical protein
LLDIQADDLRNPPTSSLELIHRLEREQPRFADKILLYRYGKKIENVAHCINYIWKKSQGSSQIDESKYKIDFRGRSLTVTEKTTGVEIFQRLENAVKSNLKVENIEDFIKMGRLLEDVGILGKTIVFK